MSQGYSPRIFPFSTDSSTGFTQNMTIQQLASQNLINLILTAPGERIMDLGFGVGLRNYLFLMNDASTMSALSAAIKSQVATWLPYIKILEINYDESDPDQNLLKINLAYEILSDEAGATLAGVGISAGEATPIRIVEYSEDGGVLVPANSDAALDAGTNPQAQLFSNPFETENTVGSGLMTLGGARTSEEEAYDDDESPYVESGLYVDENTLTEHKHVGASYWRNTRQSSLGKT